MDVVQRRHTDEGSSMRLGSTAPMSVVAALLVALLASCTSSGGAASSSAADSSSSAVRTSSSTASAPADRVRFEIDPSSTMMDEPVDIRVSGLPADAQVTIAASATDVDGVAWRSSATFVASADGTVSTGQPSVGGSYRGSNAMGLFEVMTPLSSSRSQFFRAPEQPSFPVTLVATVDGAPIAQTTVDRGTYLSKGVTTTQYLPAADGIFGSYSAPPPTSRARPAVLLFGGSEGGNVLTNVGKLLAAQGIPTLSVAYFAEPGLPPTLQDIPLEYFRKALQVLARQPGVDPQKMFVWGVSRGTEAALLVGVHYPDLVHGVVAGAPGALVFGNFPGGTRPAWTLAGKPVPFVPGDEFGTTDLTAHPDAVIPVEKIRGPIFTACGGQDSVWPSCTYATAITRRLQNHHSPYRNVALSYPSAGHAVGVMWGYVSITTDDGGGGTVIGNAAALADAHTRLLAFLRGS